MKDCNKSYEKRKLLYEGFKIELDKCIKNRYDIHNVICNIHEELEYGKVDFKDILEYYKLEYIMAQISLLSSKGIMLNTNLVKYYENLFKEKLEHMLKEIDLCVKVWFLRELYYFYDNLNGAKRYYTSLSEGEDDWYDLSESEASHLEEYTDLDIYSFIEGLYTNKKELLDEYTDCIKEQAEDYSSCTCIQTYFDMIGYYENSFKLNPQARFNYLLNIAHNNGIMATKFIVHEHYSYKEIEKMLNHNDWWRLRGECEERILTSLSEGRFAEKLNNKIGIEFKVPSILLV